MNGRIYDPSLARFLSPDPLVSNPYNSQTYNRYSYVANNPFSATDPSGYAGLVIDYETQYIIGEFQYKDAGALLNTLVADTVSVSNGSVSGSLPSGFVSGSSPDITSGLTFVNGSGYTGSVSSNLAEIEANYLANHPSNMLTGSGASRSSTSVQSGPSIDGSGRVTTKIKSNSYTESVFCCDSGRSNAGPSRVRKPRIIDVEIGEGKSQTISSRVVRPSPGSAQIRKKLLAPVEHSELKDEVTRLRSTVNLTGAPPAIDNGRAPQFTNFGQKIRNGAGRGHNGSVSRGWSFGDPLPQGVVDFSAGLGNGILLGQGEYLRGLFNVDGSIDSNSINYRRGELLGVAASALTTSAAAIAGGKAAGIATAYTFTSAGLNFSANKNFGGALDSTNGLVGLAVSSTPQGRVAAAVINLNASLTVPLFRE